LVLSAIRRIDTGTFIDVATFVNGVMSASGDKGTRGLRRRVYDVLNIFLAVGIISRDGKKIHFIGGAMLPSDGVLFPATPQVDKTSRPRERREAAPPPTGERKCKFLARLRDAVALRCLVARNRAEGVCVRGPRSLPIGATLIVSLPRGTPRSGWSFRVCGGEPRVHSPMEIVRLMVFTREERMRAFASLLGAVQHPEFLRPWRDLAVALEAGE
jgi:hypothetical protein